MIHIQEVYVQTNSLQAPELTHTCGPSVPNQTIKNSGAHLHVHILKSP